MFARWLPRFNYVCNVCKNDGKSQRGVCICALLNHMWPDGGLLGCGNQRAVMLHWCCMLHVVCGIFLGSEGETGISTPLPKPHHWHWEETRKFSHLWTPSLSARVSTPGSTGGTPDSGETTRGYCGTPRGIFNVRHRST